MATYRWSGTKEKRNWKYKCVREVKGKIEKAKTQTAGCAEHMKQRNYAEQRELKSLSYLGIG